MKQTAARLRRRSTGGKQNEPSDRGKVDSRPRPRAREESALIRSDQYRSTNGHYEGREIRSGSAPPSRRVCNSTGRTMCPATRARISPVTAAGKRWRVRPLPPGSLTRSIQLCPIGLGEPRAPCRHTANHLDCLKQRRAWTRQEHRCSPGRASSTITGVKPSRCLTDASLPATPTGSPSSAWAKNARLRERGDVRSGDVRLCKRLVNGIWEPGTIPEAEAEVSGDVMSERATVEDDKSAELPAASVLPTPSAPRPGGASRLGLRLV